MAELKVQGNDFMYEGSPLRIFSGSIHYFRVVPEYWRDRLLKLKACGFNTVETYVAWNVHEPEEGNFVFDGLGDIEEFIRTAGELGLHVIVRPSPYICAEWEFGGLPAWLLADTSMYLRCFDRAYLDKVDRYFDELLPRLKPLLCTNGGPIIAMQIENEYGSYGNDKQYLNYLKDGMISRGMDVLLFTSDGPEDHMLQGGMVEGVLETVNFGSRAQEAFEKLREYQPEGPLMCMEFWNGWFDHWMEEHQSRPAEDVAEALDEMLREGASVNFYMFHGGTNFGFYNGANHIQRYEPTVTSYDYDTLLSESGDPTPKFYAVREILSRYTELPELVLPEPIRKKAYGKVNMTEQAGLFSNLEKLAQPIRYASPLPMEKVGQSYGFILYSTRISGPRKGFELVLQDVHDRALVFADGKYRGTVERWNPAAIPLDIPAEGLKLDVLVENMGRVNYGPLMRDSKGITEGIRLGNQFLYDWTIHPLPMKDLSDLHFEPLREGEASAQEETPSFYRGLFEVSDKADTFIRLDGWKKGVVYVNGFNLGRYWEAGPQKTLYIPAPLLKDGSNELVIFELHGTSEPVVSLVDTPDLG
ncbi:beta-galactosidase [Paenibacillus sp. J23TS9]|uniref:glycoside hydrolase family 35 protein n=1 Tax=Paenibacillus sp. J23TS9 TaxID=2807193 RepID=UPI001B1D580B|nr:beta-galactosidase family protein [Paenibacillus sp. J23TS9]GIP27549.1 beta-galactosidase [Paenibacillus sp. J23TS9]